MDAVLCLERRPAVFLTTLIIIGQALEDRPQNTIQAELPPKSEPEFEATEERDIREEKKEIPKTEPKRTEKSAVVPMENIEVSDHFEVDTQSDFSEMLDADVDNQLLSDTADIGNFAGIGAGGGSGGAFGL